MKKWLIYGLLVCSLIFNAIFIIGAYRCRARIPMEPPPRMKPPKMDAMRDFFELNKTELVNDMQEYKKIRGRIADKMFDKNTEIEDMILLGDSLIEITVKREKKFVRCLINYQNNKKRKGN